MDLWQQLKKPLMLSKLSPITSFFLSQTLRFNFKLKRRTRQKKTLLLLHKLKPLKSLTEESRCVSLLRPMISQQSYFKHFS